ncbi:MAG: M23 family metallopeptidase, partial [Parcubacteria group bacterium]
MNLLSLKFRKRKKRLWLLLPLVSVLVYLAVGHSNDREGIVANVNSTLPDNPAVQASENISVSIAPYTILQGDPAQITIKGIYPASEIQSLAFDGKSVPLFLHNGEPTALVGIDLRGRTGVYPLVLTLKNGEKLEKPLVVSARLIVKAPLGIPEKLGGDTPEAEKELINTLVQEATVINAIPTTDKILWSGEFRFPLADENLVTDVYGYSRVTGASTLSHKGTDFRAETGTSVYAMNSGLVSFVDYLRNYGNTVIIDHGLGLSTIYMHLSETNVEVGAPVEKGELIGKSGDTGYVLGPHL